MLRLSGMTLIVSGTFYFAAIPEQWLTAFQTAIDIGGLSKGKSILVHAGAR